MHRLPDLDDVPARFGDDGAHLVLLGGVEVQGPRKPTDDEVHRGAAPARAPSRKTSRTPRIDFHRFMAVTLPVCRARKARTFTRVSLHSVNSATSRTDLSSSSNSVITGRSSGLRRDIAWSRIMRASWAEWPFPVEGSSTSAVNPLCNVFIVPSLVGHFGSAIYLLKAEGR